MKKIFFLLVGLTLFFPSQALAEPTDDCISLAQSQAKKIALAADFESELLAWQPLVDLGCLPSNPAGKKFTDGDAREECLVLSEQGSVFLRPFNQQLKAYFQKVDSRKKTFSKNSQKINKKIKKAKSKAQKRKLKKIKTRLIKNNQLALNALKKRNSSLINGSAARFILISGNLKARDCLIDDIWLYINRFSWQAVALT